jgi:hypothetical protein
VPFGRGTAVSTHCCVPVAHEVWCTVQAFAGVQSRPAVQPTHEPPLHTWSVPQLVPFGSGVAVEMQVCAPVAQEVTPVRHGSGSVAQARPAVQAVQAPALQTRSVPHGVPFGSGTAPLSTQVEVPVAHEVMPVRHGSGFVAQVRPAVQATHVPPLQTWFVPQPVPFGICVAVSTQVCEPVAQEVVPATHGFGLFEQGPPAVQVEQTPPLQTWSGPQERPFGSGTAGLSTHVSAPVEQEVSPVRQKVGFVVQTRPAVQAMQPPVPLQTWFTPQRVPPGFGVAVFSQVSEPVAQDVTPSTHGFEL